MAIDKLKERIEQDALEQAKKIEQEARKEAEGLLSSAKDQAGLEEQIRLEKAKTDAELRKSSIIARSRLEAKDMLLESKRKALDKAFDLALDRLNNLQEAVYQEALSKLSRRYSTGKEKIIDTKEKGLILIDEQGAQIDLTFKSLIDHYREELEQEVYKILNPPSLRGDK